jgi:biopolymer transport protein ExbD
MPDVRRLSIEAGTSSAFVGLTTQANMKLEPITLRPLAGPPIQFALLLPILVLFILVTPRFPRCCTGTPFVALPQMPGADRVISTEADIVITVQATGFVFIGAKWFPPAELVTRLQQLAVTSPSNHVLLRLDRALPFGSVRTLLRHLSDAGFTRVSFLTSEGYAGEELPFAALFKGAV